MAWCVAHFHIKPRAKLTGLFSLGSGSMSYPIVYALEGKKPPTVIGKPNTTMMDAIIAEYVPCHRNISSQAAWTVY